MGELLEGRADKRTRESLYLASASVLTTSLQKPSRQLVPKGDPAGSAQGQFPHLGHSPLGLPLESVPRSAGWEPEGGQDTAAGVTRWVLFLGWADGMIGR